MALGRVPRLEIALVGVPKANPGATKAVLCVLPRRAREPLAQLAFKLSRILAKLRTC